MSSQNETIRYTARLYRGWNWVRLTYALEGDAIVVREQRIPGVGGERRVAIASLTGEVHTIFARQPVYRFSLIVFAIAAMAAVLDLAATKMMPEGGGVLHWQIWAASIVLGVPAGLIAWGTRKPREWANFKGSATGLYILKDKRDAEGYRRFIQTLNRRLKTAGRG